MARLLITDSATRCRAGEGCPLLTERAHRRARRWAPRRAPRSAPRWALLLLGGTVGLAGCTSMHVKRATYQMLRQGECQLNAYDEFCDRNYVAEYHEYERLRNDFLHETRLEHPPPLTRSLVGARLVRPPARRLDRHAARLAERPARRSLADRIPVDRAPGQRSSPICQESRSCHAAPASPRSSPTAAPPPTPRRTRSQPSHAPPMTAPPRSRSM